MDNIAGEKRPAENTAEETSTEVRLPQVLLSTSHPPPPPPESMAYKLISALGLYQAS